MYTGAAGAEEELLQDLPRISASYTAVAALANQTKAELCPFPRHMPLGQIIDRTYVKSMVSTHAATVQDAFNACHGLTVLNGPWKTVARLVQAENKELEHAALGVKPLDDSLPARQVSLAALVTGETCRHSGAYSFLNAMAHLASSPSNPLGSRQELADMVSDANKHTTTTTTDPTDSASSTANPQSLGLQVPHGSNTSLQQPSAPLAQTARVAFVVGEDACEYIKSRMNSMPANSADLRAYMRDPSELLLAISWAQREGANARLHTRLVPLQMPSSNTSDAYYDAVVSTLARFSEETGLILPGAVFATRDTCTAKSYVDAAKQVSDAYANIICPDVSVRLSAYLRSEHCRCPLDFSGTFVRMLPQATGMTSPKCSHGILVHERGREADVRQFMRHVAGEERERGAAIYGLRPPSPTIAEESLGLHVLDIQAEGMSMGRQVSLYGMHGVPGMRLSLNDGSHVWRIVRRIHELDAEFVRIAFVLPCKRESCEPESASLRLPSFVLMENAVQETVERFERPSTGAPSLLGGGAPLDHGRMDPFDLERPGDLPAGPVDPEVAFVNTAFGLGLNCPACRIGDVYDAAQTRGAPASILSMLVAAIARSGREESVTVAIGAVGKHILTSETLAANLQQDVQRLTSELRVYAAAAESEQSQSHSNQPPSAGAIPDAVSDDEGADTTSAPPTKRQRVSTPEDGSRGSDDVTTLSPVGAGRLALALGVKLGANGVQIKPGEKLSVEKVLAVVAKACGIKKSALPAQACDQSRGLAICDNDSAADRVLAAVKPLAEAIQTPIFLLANSTSGTVWAIDTQTGSNVPITWLLNESSTTPRLLALSSSDMLMYYEQSP